MTTWRKLSNQRKYELLSQLKRKPLHALLSSKTKPAKQRKPCYHQLSNEPNEAHCVSYLMNKHYWMRNFEPFYHHLCLWRHKCFMVLNVEHPLNFCGKENVIARLRRWVCGRFLFPSIVYILVVEINHEVVDKPVLVVMPTNTNSFRNKKEELFSHRVSQSHDCIVKNPFW